MNFKIKHEVFYQNYVAAVLFAVKNIYIYICVCVCVFKLYHTFVGD